MPLVGFRPTKARLVVENARSSVLVLKVALDDDIVALVTGGTLADLGGVLRIREANGDSPRNGNGTTRGGRPKIGSLTHVPASSDGASGGAAKFQLEVTMAADKFAHLMRAANAGRMPTRFMVDVGGDGTEGIAYRVRGGGREKLWDNAAFRVLPVTHFVMILPLDVAGDAPATAPVTAAAAADAAWATNAQITDMMDDMLTFQSDTRNTMFGLLCVLGILALAALVLGVATLFH